MIGFVLVCVVVVTSNLDSGYDYHRENAIFFEEEPQMGNMHGHLGMSDEDKVPMAPLDDFEVDVTTPVIEEQDDNVTVLPQVDYGDDSTGNLKISSRLGLTEDDSVTEMQQEEIVSELPGSDIDSTENPVEFGDISLQPEIVSDLENEEIHYEIDHGLKILPLNEDFIVDDLDAPRTLEDDFIAKDASYEEIPGHVLTNEGYVYRDPRVRY